MKMMLLAAASLLIATGASAQTSTTATKPAPAAAKTVPAATKPAPKPVAKTVAGNKVTTTTSTGKKITYDCSKKGNLNKKACKG